MSGKLSLLSVRNLDDLACFIVALSPCCFVAISFA